MGVLTDLISWVLKTSAIPMDVYSVQLRPTLCNPMDCNMPGLPVHHQLPEFTQIHVRWVGDAIQPSHPLSSPSPPALNLFQHQGLFKWFSSLHQAAKVLRVSASTSVLPMNTQDWSPLGWTGWISLLSKGHSRIFSNTTVQKHQFFSTQLSLQFNSHIPSFIHNSLIIKRCWVSFHMLIGPMRFPFKLFAYFKNCPFLIVKSSLYLQEFISLYISE